MVLCPHLGAAAPPARIAVSNPRVGWRGGGAVAPKGSDIDVASSVREHPGGLVAAMLGAKVTHEFTVKEKHVSVDVNFEIC